MFAAFSMVPTWMVIAGLALLGGIVLVVGIVVALAMMAGPSRE